MNHKYESSSSPSPSVSSTDNGSTVADTFSFAPEGGYQSTHQCEESTAIPRTEAPLSGPGKLVPRRRHDVDSKEELLELGHSSPLKNGDSQRSNRQEDKDNREMHPRIGDVQACLGMTHIDTQLETSSERENHLATKSEPVLKESCTSPSDYQSSGKPNISPKNGRYNIEDVALGMERGHKLEQRGLVEKPNPPKRELLATTSAPVRLASALPLRMPVSECKPLQHNHAEAHEDGSNCTSPLSSKSDDLQSLSDQTGGATCGSGTERSLVRTKSLPSRSFSEVEELSEYRRSNTQSGGRRLKSRNKEDLNVRLVAQEKLSDRKKKKLMKHLATIKKDGTVEFDVAGSARLASNLFGPGIFDEGGTVGEEEMIEEDDDKSRRDVPPLQIVMLIVGTRGDVQPFVAIGKHLQEYGHRVRLATHTNFREFVMTAGLEFYPLGGDPKVLAGYMVKNKGFLPSGPGEIQVQRKQIKAIINSLLPACVATDTESGNAVPFRAQAIIANPPAYGLTKLHQGVTVTCSGAKLDVIYCEFEPRADNGNPDLIIGDY